MDEQGVIVLGSPIGSSEFVGRWIQEKLSEHKPLLERIPAMEDLQCAWLLLLLCGSSRADYTLRNLRP